MKKSFAFGLIMAALFTGINASAQLPDCTLSIGGKDTAVLIQVFQLNEEQKNTMEMWIGELQTQNKLIEDEIKVLLEKHPQSTQEDLETLAKKYKVLKDKMLAISKGYDSKLLGLFNPKQYQRYAELCNEALRKPITPSITAKAEPQPENPD
ncbi:hypothetical protein [Muriicola sp. Z0-33]|uniref:hypothetical protein n=1 Tax=Muriicola sp. Z0-33 TaxID=2816957 RepID=UPI002238B9D1|nr:hypothetical protein [Muriicola sp. Z0-33]MCW5517545.1 hypothetical protein [Muriicola sp. Z0-33]